MSDLVRVADLPQNVADAVTAAIDAGAMTSLDVDDVELNRNERDDDERVPFLDGLVEPLAQTRRSSTPRGPADSGGLMHLHVRFQS